MASLVVRLVSRDSTESGRLTAICDACAAACEDHEDEACRACVEVRPDCADACRTLAEK